MQKNPLIGVSIIVVVLLILGSLANVVGYQTVQSSDQKIINEDRSNQKELLFQTILDIANNKDIQKIIQNSEIKKGFGTSFQLPGAKSQLMIPRMRFNMLLRPPLVLTKSFLENAFNIGVRLSKTYDSSRIHSILEQYKINNQGMQKEMTIVIEKNNNLNKKIGQLSDSHCDCEKNSTTGWNFPIYCAILSVILLFLIYIIVNNPYSPFIMALYTILQVGIILCV